ncbi:MAG: phosphatidylglycerol lysyltransferase domain-containing protein [Oscillospiraceae bacterium]|nr:phosphatidylglycerol lysyltransferase domain-containing protein [Oscillospiraceae bacterium]
MLEFNRLTLDNASNVKSLFTHTYSRLCDYVFGTVLLWRDMWPTEFAVSDNSLFLRVEVEEGKTEYMLPITDNLEHALGTLDSYQPGPKTYCYVPETEIDTLKRHYSNIDIEIGNLNGDYLYCADAMATLSGRKLHGKRNHSNYFDRTWSHHFEEITSSNAQDIKDFIALKTVIASSDIFIEGNKKILEALDNLESYDFSTLALYVDNHVVGFTLGTLLGDTLYVNVEQADRDYRGAYPKLASEFIARHLDDGVAYVNREDDLDDEGLRKAKLAWNPCDVIQRFSVEVR